jgi:hypothetical protein
MRRTIIIILAALLLLAMLILFLINSRITGNVIREYTFTKAICNSTNFCQDYLVECRGSSITKMTPVTGAVIQHSAGWKDPRNSSERELCR